MTSNKKLMVFWLAVQVILGIALIWWLLTTHNINVDELFQRLGEISILPAFLGMICFGTTMVFGALRYRTLLLPSIPLRYMFGVTIIQNALLTFMPWRSGEVSYPLLLHRDYKIPLASSGAVILLVRLTDLLIISVLSFVAASRLGLDVRWLVVFVVAGLVMVAIGIGFVAKFQERIPLLQTFKAAFLPLRRPKQLAMFVFLSLCIFVLTTLQSTLILHAMAFDISILDAAELNALTLIVALLPIHPPGGWGTIDSVQVLILSRIGYNATEAGISILAAHSLYTVMILAGGLLGWLIRGRQRVALRAD